MGILEEIQTEETWREFLAQKKAKSYFSEKESVWWQKYVDEKKYLPLVTRMGAKNFRFGVVQKKLINKLGTKKKRVVYTLSEEENVVLKVMAFLLYRYDEQQASLCFSFRKNYGAKRAIHQLIKMSTIEKMYGYKVDVTNYFNSIDVDLLLPQLKKIMMDDRPFYQLLARWLKDERVEFEGKIITEKKGVMAGTPTSPFLANIYLKELDEHFEQLKMPYARYSDDIIFFAETVGEREREKNYLLDFLQENMLSVNQEKEILIEPGQAWEFLGISYQEGQIDLSETTKKKIKGKIRRKARALRRWKLKKEIPDATARRTLVKIFNYKFFAQVTGNELSWAKWFFPLLTTTVGLREVDNYLQENLRYLTTGRHNKANYRVSYADLKADGYRSLVHEYYLYKKQIKEG